MPKNDKLHRDINPFVESVAALFAEQSAKGLNPPDSFRLLREQLITFLELCSKEGITRARASHSFILPNGTKPDTELQRPPTWMKFGAGERETLERTRKAKRVVNSLTAILKQQSRAEKRKAWAALNTTFSDSSPEPEPIKRKRYGEVEDDEYEPPQPKKSKVQQPTLGVQPPPKTSRKIKARRTSSGWSTGPPQKISGDKRQSTLDFKVAKNAKESREHKEANRNAVAKLWSRSPFSNGTQHRIKKEEEQPQLCADLESENTKPAVNDDTVVSNNASPGIDEHGRGSTLEQRTTLSPTQQVSPDLREQSAEAAEGAVFKDQERSVIIHDDDEIDTDSEDDCGTHEGMRPITSMPVDISGNPEFWPSAPKTSKSTATTILHQYALPLRRKEKEVDTPLGRLRTSLEIYETQIAHIPREAWKVYHRRLEKFCQKPGFSDLPFFERFCGFRQIIYLEEEDAVAHCDDWERLRKAAKLCGFLTEVTAPQGEDVRRLIEREVSVNLRDIDWLAKLYSNKHHLWS